MAEFALTSFKSQTLQNLYNNNADLIAFRDRLESKVAQFVSVGLDDPQKLLELIDGRIAQFENVIIDPQPAAIDPNKPYDRASLAREFLEEVYSVLMMDRFAYSADIDPGTPVTPGQLPGFHVRNYADFDNLRNQGNYNDLDNTARGVLNFYESFIQQVFAEADKLKQNPKDPATGADVQAWVVTNIPRTEIDGVVYDRVTSVALHNPNDPNATAEHLTYYVPQGVDLSTVEKKPITNTKGQPVDFSFAFAPAPLIPSPNGGALQTVRLLQVDIQEVANPDGSRTLNVTPLGFKTVSGFRAMSLIEFLYFWNESRIKILKGQLAFKQAITQEIQEDLRQANEALGDLEGKAAIRQTDDKGQPVNDTSPETIRMNLLAARVSQKGTRIFDDTGGDVNHKYGDWQKNRANLKNYIDRKSAQSQDAMLDYQQLLNRYNNALEIMSKLQEKIDGLLKGQLRNL